MAWNRAELATLAVLRDEGHSKKEIARRMGKDPRDVARKVSRLGQEKSLVWTEEETVLAVRLKADGLNAPQIAARLGRTAHSVRTRLLRVPKLKHLPRRVLVEREIAATAKDREYVARCLAEGGFCSRHLIEGRVVEVWPVAA